MFGVRALVNLIVEKVYFNLYYFDRFVPQSHAQIPAYLVIFRRSRSRIFFKTGNSGISWHA